MYSKLALHFQDFEKKGPIFKKFVNLLISLKETMNPTSSNGKYNEWHHFTFVKWLKQYLNHAYGKLSMKPYEDKSTFCNTMQDLTNIILSDDVLSIVPVSVNLIDVISASKPSNGRRPTTCVPLGVHIFAFARQLLDTKIQEAKEIFPSSKIYMVNTDSCVMSIPQHESISDLYLSPKIGHWKHQIKDCQEILKFYSLNAVTYHISYLSNKNEVHQMTKMAGFRLNNILATSIDSSDFEDLVKKAVSHEKKEIIVGQLRTRNNPGFAPTETVIQFCLKNSLDGKRVVNKFQAYPYGFKDK